MATFDQNLVGSFIERYNFRPLILTYTEIQAMKTALSRSKGTLIICPAFTTSVGIPESVVVLRYVLYKIVNKTYVPVRFDFKPVEGDTEQYNNYLKSATFPNFILPQSPPVSPAASIPCLDNLFSFLDETTPDPNAGVPIPKNKNNYFSYFLQQNPDGTISLNSTILTIRSSGAGGPGVETVKTGGPPPPP